MKKLIFPIVAALLLTPWPVAYAYEAGETLQASSNVIAAEPAAAPQINAYGNAIGGVTPGDLFYIETANVTTDTQVALHITNTDELVNSYRYMNLNIGIYVQDEEGGWEKISTGEPGALPNTYITMNNGVVRFALPSYHKYKITVEKGCFYCHGVDDGGKIASPSFYLALG